MDSVGERHAEGWANGSTLGTLRVILCILGSGSGGEKEVTPMNVLQRRLTKLEKARSDALDAEIFALLAMRRAGGMTKAALLELRNEIRPEAEAGRTLVVAAFAPRGGQEGEEK